jgi:hypothetical protein
MRHRITVRLIASDPLLYSSAASTLGAANYEIANAESAEQTPSDVVLRHWAEAEAFDRYPVPEVTLDLSRICGDALVKVVERVLGRPALVVQLDPWRPGPVH